MKYFDKPKNDEEYWFAFEDGIFFGIFQDGCKTCEEDWNDRILFSTQEEAQEDYERRFLWQKN